MRPISFLSDYGYDDEFAGVCRAVIAQIAPAVPVIDLTHGIERHAVRQGSFVLANALPYAPPGVHLAVVDPGVGTDRRAVAVRAATEDRLLVGPDNGLLWPAIERFGGAAECVDVGRSPFRLEPVSATFHGRDLFAPVAARLALGASLREAGEPIDAHSLQQLRATAPRLEADRVVAHVLYIDRYGNVVLDLAGEWLGAEPLRGGARLSVGIGARRFELVVAETFAAVEAGRLLLYEDSYRRLALAVNRGDAAETLGVAVGDEVVLSALPAPP